MERKHNAPRRGPGMPPGVGERAKDFSGTLRKLSKQLGRFRISLAGVVVLSAGSAVFSIIGPKKMGEITTEI